MVTALREQLLTLGSRAQERPWTGKWRTAKGQGTIPAKQLYAGTKHRRVGDTGDRSHGTQGVGLGPGLFSHSPAQSRWGHTQVHQAT